ncbi:MAG: PorT family protein [Prevotellaceae bacterium]|nr:PorT family protein [Prevotellaceae bacterium]
MKKLFINIIFLFAIIASADAQMLYKPELYIGAASGATIAKVGFSPKIHQSFVLGVNAGATFRYVTEKYFGMQIELNVSQMGWKEDSTSFSKNMTYIELPFLTHIYFGQTTRVFVNLGPQIGFLLHERTDAPPEKDAEFQHTTSLQRKFDYGFAVGLGISVPIKKNTIQLEIRGYYGMGDIYQNRKEDWFQRSNNMQAAVSLGWYFRLK